MTPTLLSATSPAYLTSTATASDTSATSVDGSALSATASEESSDDHRDDAVPSDFAVLLAAMMAPTVPSPLRPRVEPADASNASAPASAVGGAVAAASPGLVNLIPMSSSGVGTSGVTSIALEVDPLSPANASTSAQLGASASTPSTSTDTLETQAPGGADPTVSANATTQLEGAAPSRVDELTESVLVSASMTERESPAPSFGLVALDRPVSLGRGVTVPLVRGSASPVAGVSLQADGSSALVGPEVGIASTEAPSAQSVAPSSNDAVSVLATLAADALTVSASGNDAVSAIATLPADALTASPSASLTTALTARVIPRSLHDEALDATSAAKGGDPMPVGADASAPTAPAAESPNSAPAQNGVALVATTGPGQSGRGAEPTRVSRDEPSAGKAKDETPSAVGVSAGASPASPADRPGSVEVTTPPVVEGVRPGDTSQHIVRAALRAQAADGTQHMRLEMHPGDLGAVAVEVTIEGGAVHVAMVAERGETKDLLRSSIGELRSSLVAAGFSAGRVDIQSGLSDSRFGHAADRHDAWSQSFDRPDSRRDHSGAFSNMFDQSSAPGDQSRSSRPFGEAGALRDALPLRGARSSDRQEPGAAISTKGPRRDRLDVHL